MKKKSKKKTFKLKRVRVDSIFDQIRKLLPLVRLILETDPLSRDDDNRLCILVWKNQGMKEKHTFKYFKFKMILNQLTTPESISRTRRYLQALPGSKLRGKLFKERHEADIKLQEKLRSQLSFF